jgi:hypothetical protein
MESAKSSHATARTLPYHPSIKKETMQSLITNFPAAQSTTESVQKINNAILSLGCKTDNTLFACSICPDEINHHSGSINRRLADFWGACFYMGGLGGLPFVGKVGFGAYSHHVPKDGHLFILFAPHVGLSPDGLVGKYARAGQDHLDSACGAAIGAFGTLQKHRKADGSFDEQALLSAASPLDQQFSYIIQHMKPKYAQIASHPNP